MNDAVVQQTVKALRDAHYFRIMQNPVYVEIRVRPLVDNGYSIMIPDMSKDEEVKMFGPVRVAPEGTPVLQERGSEFDKINDTGIHNSYYLTAVYNETFLQRNMIISFNDRKYRMFEPTVTLYHGFGIGLIVRLEDVTESMGSLVDVGVVATVIGSGEYAVGFAPDAVGSSS